ncbi:MAG: OmpA family protein [Chitinophagales bacterium]
MKCIFFIFFLHSVSLFSQSVQWASTVKKFSTEASRTRYAAKQVLGKPSVLPAWGESPTAWASAEMDSPNEEFIHVGFQKPMQIKQVAIGESHNPGAIQEVILFSDAGKKYSVYKNDTVKPKWSTGGRMFHIILPLTEYKVAEVKVILTTKKIGGSNQIDCIGISNSDVPVEAIVNEIQYAKEVGKPENLGPQVNSRYDDMLPIISPDGKTLYFARKLHPENIGEDKRDDIWYATQKNERWEAAKHFNQPLNNEHHNFVSWISADGNTIFLANDYKNPAGGQQVSISQKKNEDWQFPKRLPVDDMYSRNEFSCYHANTEGTVMLMAIEREITFGDMDIYVSFKRKNGSWTEPKNIGNVINTAAREGSVFIAADNTTIYFSSEGFSGYGGFDMYMSKRLDDTWLNWSEPVNLGKKINSKADDFYYTIPASGDYAYFSSRESEYGKSDIYRIKLPEEIQPDPVALIKGKIIDAETKEPVPVEIEFGALLGENEKGTSHADEGNYEIVVPAKTYGITIDKEGYFPVMRDLQYDPTIEELDYDDSTQIEVDTIIEEKYSEQEQDIEIVPLKEGQILSLDNVFFDANRATLKEISKTQLDQMSAFLVENKNIYVEIGGHTNGLPEDDFCQKLSDARAEAVSEYFIDKGVSADRVTWKGYGKTKPVADNITVEGRKKNQRVELKVIKVE